MNILHNVALIVVFCLRFLVADERRLNEYIQHYEGLNYDTNELHENHNRAKRSTDSQPVALQFHAHGRHFNIRLRRDTTTFSSDAAVLKHDGQEEPLKFDHIYEGEIWGEKGSHVHGSIIRGVFAGKISSNRGEYYVERADVYFAEPQSFHSIIYNEDHVNDDPHKERRKADKTGQCGNEAAREWMEKVQNSAVKKPVKKKQPTESQMNQSPNGPHDWYTPNQRHKRAVDSQVDDRRTCTLYLRSDTMLWNRMTGPRSKNGLSYDADRAREEISSLFALHVIGIKKIYMNTVFVTMDKTLSHSGISFIVRRVKIDESDTECPQGEDTPNNEFCNPKIDVSYFLNLNSKHKHNDFCLAYIFTYRDFIGGTLGLAWVGSDSRASGGICENHKEYNENGKTVMKSLNTGIVTLINYGSPVPPKVSTLTFAHEVGHNFGSPHDQGDICTPFASTPSDPEGNFIMYASATSGDRPNNSKFSICSKDNITRVLQAVFEAEYGKDNCFVASESTFCGNSLVDSDEECDCGYENECKDQCCFARGSPDECKRKPQKTCSPTEGPCCRNNCEYVVEDALECFKESDCNHPSSCNGIASECPIPDPKANMTACNKHTQICINGECVGSICQKILWDQCFLTAPEKGVQEDNYKEKLCYVACLNPTDLSCVSSGDEEALKLPSNQPLRDLLDGLQQESIKLPPGAPCNDLRGYCDVFQKCRDVDADGPLSRLKKLLFNEQTFNEVRFWIVKHWYAVLFMGLGLIIFMGAFIKICAVHTPSSNPNKVKARKLTLRRPTNRHQGPPPAYSGPSRGGPPHGKGRGPSANPGSRAPQYEMRPRKL